MPNTKKCIVSEGLSHLSLAFDEFSLGNNCEAREEWLKSFVLIFEALNVAEVEGLKRKYPNLMGFLEKEPESWDVVEVGDMRSRCEIVKDRFCIRYL